MKLVMVSGGFDPVHSGHLNLLSEAATYGRVIVALNTDRWLERKKGFFLLPYSEREAVLKAICYVTELTPVNDADGSVCEAIRRIRPDVFCNGGDRDHADRREHAVCEELGIVEKFSVGGAAKIASSSVLFEQAMKRLQSR